MSYVCCFLYLNIVSFNSCSCVNYLWKKLRRVFDNVSTLKTAYLSKVVVFIYFFFWKERTLSYSNCSENSPFKGLYMHSLYTLPHIFHQHLLCRSTLAKYEMSVCQLQGFVRALITT